MDTLGSIQLINENDQGLNDIFSSRFTTALIQRVIEETKGIFSAQYIILFNSDKIRMEKTHITIIISP